MLFLSLIGTLFKKGNSAPAQELLPLAGLPPGVEMQTQSLRDSLPAPSTCLCLHEDRRHGTQLAMLLRGKKCTKVVVEPPPPLW
mmetsp:Transcript_29548/g.83349  ORF Transcript_29548/g.83349 Transcript_29548/m.83349 type:complete len:84 (-) Transcript_29548:78-329(-)